MTAQGAPHDMPRAPEKTRFVPIAARSMQFPAREPELR
jgi:hypothetical protein